MSWVTVLWSMFAAASLTLAVVHLLTWWQRRTALASLLFALAATSPFAQTTNACPDKNINSHRNRRRLQ